MTTAAIRPLIDSRPPSIPWRPATPSLAVPDQPPLDLGPSPDPDPAPPAPGAVRVTLVRASWNARPAPDLPDVPVWSARLVVAIVQVLLAQRPVAQLNRWLAEDVLAEVSLQQRRRRTSRQRAAVPVTLVSLRVQYPAPDAAEIAAHVLIGARHQALAMRLEALGDRWLCVALELSPASHPSELRPPVRPGR
jgi:hypothetical protein